MAAGRGRVYFLYWQIPEKLPVDGLMAHKSRERYDYKHTICMYEKQVKYFIKKREWWNCFCQWSVHIILEFWSSLNMPTLPRLNLHLIIKKEIVFYQQCVENCRNMKSLREYSSGSCYYLDELIFSKIIS